MLQSFLFVVLMSCLSFTNPAFAQDRFPEGPNAQMTPGKLCDQPDSYRYPEHIAYCSRNVDPSVKRQLFKDYDQQLGFDTQSMNRQDFKIDHYIPLCAGGSNDRSNLWPQYKDVYNVTDPMEPLVCEKMQEGVLKQADAVILIKRGKNDLSQVPAIIAQLQAL